MGSREDVNIKVSANVAEAIQMWKAMEAGPDGMAKALAAMGDKGGKSTKTLGEEIGSLVGKWATVGAATAAVTSEIRAQVTALQDLRKAKLEVTNNVDEVWTQFQVQSGLPNGKQADAVRTQLLQIIANRKAAPIPGLQSAVALGSAGASVQDITGGGLDEFLQMVTASNAAGKDVNQAELASSLVKFLKANGRSPNREGMQGTSLAIQQLFGGTNLQASNLSRFARDAGSIASMSRMSPEDQLAQFSMLLDTMSEDTASTAFKSGVISLATSGGNREKMRGLSMLGLKPGDVDFQGEEWGDVYGRLNKGFAGVAPEKRNVAAKLLFGDEGLPFYTTFLEDGDLAEAQKRGGMARNAAGAAGRLNTAEGSRSAGARQAESAAANYMYDRNIQDPKVVKDRIRALGGMVGLDDWMVSRMEKTLDDESDLFGLKDVDIDERIRRTAIVAEQMSSIPSAPWEKPRGRMIGYEEAQQYLRGERPIRIVGPDGLDVAHEPAAADLSEQPGQTQ